VTFTCGLVGYPHRRFMGATAAAGAIWASYAFVIGRLGGKAFAANPWEALLLALGAAIAVTALIEATGGPSPACTGNATPLVFPRLRRQRTPANTLRGSLRPAEA